MARTIKEIKDGMTARFVADETVVAKYELEAGKTFDEQFSTVSIESLLFYIVAAAQWSLETLFDHHRTEVSALITELKPHSLRWYVSKAKAFMPGRPLLPDTDLYDTSGMTAEAIAAAQVVRFAAAVESEAVVYLKIAGEDNGERAPISADALVAFREYIREVKDAGVMVEVINETPDHFRLTMTVYYNPMVLDGTGMNFDGERPVQDAVKKFVGDLPFNGEYRNVDLVDALQQIEGVEIPELHVAETSRDGVNWTAVNAKTTPYGGYYRIYNEPDLNITFTPNV
jgi:hypothetical protein